MIDVVEITLIGGNGGNGRISFLRERARPLGGPDGGNGGWGGSVIVRANGNLRALDRLARVSKVEAVPGQSGGSVNRTGRGGRNTTIEVPVGTTVWDMTSGEPIALGDLLGHGWTLVGANGGEPGRGNVAFASATNQEPLLAEAGAAGAEVLVKLEVKILADVAIVGAPNAGKSTLLKQVSRAQPKIASYPFTTIEPVLGVVERYGRSLVLLDIPGLIEGAHKGKGLGIEFLRHTERVRVLVHLVDGTAENLTEEYSRVAAELAAHAGGLDSKPCVVAVSKVDIPEARVRYEQQRKVLTEVTGREPLALSPATGEGVEMLLEHLLNLVPPGSAPLERIETAAPQPAERSRSPVEIHREAGAYVVKQRQAERVAAMVNLDNWSARMQFHRELGRLGVLSALEAAGASTGDTVFIGATEMEWQ